MDDESLEFEVARGRLLRRRLEDQRQHLAELAGAVADTEDKVAAVHEDIAQSDSRFAEQAAGIARSARAFAEHERKERRRWSQPAD